MTKEFYVIFSSSKTLISKAISLKLDSKFCHVSISFDPTLKTMYSFGRIYERLPLPAGFITESIYRGILGKEQSEIIVCKIKVNESKYNKLYNKINDFINEERKFKYNTRGLIALLFNKSYKKQDHYFCSQFVAELLINYGIIKLNKKSEIITPNDLMKVFENNIIYSGKASNYRKKFNSEEVVRC